MNNRYATCLAFADKAADRTQRAICVLSLPSGRFRAMFVSAAIEFDLAEFVTTVSIPTNQRG